jgi:hypothetical protein
MTPEPNQEVVNDTAKLIMHRLIARALAREPWLVEQAKVSHAGTSRRFINRSFVQDWSNLLERPLPELRSQLISGSRDMNRLRLSSPFVTANGFDFTDPTLRRRIWAAARRLATGAAQGEKRRARRTRAMSA